MIISRTPLRISFTGGGSDLQSFYSYKTGEVISTSINKYIYITVNKKFDQKIRASYSITEIVDSPEQLQHELIRSALNLVAITKGIEITSISDIPSQGTGLGSSSTYTVGLLNALYAYIGHHAGAKRLAEEACRIEIEHCKKPIGKQDQYIAAYGGFQHIQFNRDESVFVNPIICSPSTIKLLQNRLLLFYTGATRSANNVLLEQNRNTQTDKSTKDMISRLVELTQFLKQSLITNQLDSFGEILHESWIAKKKLATGISNPHIDRWYDLARQQGAVGGKIAGAGGGGFLLLYALPEYHQGIIQSLSELTMIPFQFEPQGSKIIYIEENL